METKRLWIGILAGIAAIPLLSALAVGTIVLIEFGASLIGTSSPLQHVASLHQAHISSENRNGYWPYSLLGGFGLLVIIGLSVALAVTEGKGIVWKRYACYIALLIFLQFSLFYNMAYGAGDVLISRTVQAGLNLLILFLSSVCLLLLYQTRTVSVEGKVLKALTLAFLCFFGVAATGIITILWFLNQINVISLKQAEAFSPAWVSAVSGAVSAVVGYLNYRHSASKAATPKEPLIIRPQ